MMEVARKAYCVVKVGDKVDFNGIPKKSLLDLKLCLFFHEPAEILNNINPTTPSCLEILFSVSFTDMN